MRRILFALLLALPFSVNAYCAKLAYTGIAADVITTVGAIESGRGTEANPIYPKGDLFYPALLGVAALRAWAVYRIDQIRVPIVIKETENGKLYTLHNPYSKLNCIIGSVTWAVAGNNAAIWANKPDDRLGYAAAGAIVPLFTFRFGG